METKRKALGKGLEQLFSNDFFDVNEFEKSIVDNAKSDDVVLISLDELRSNPYQPRKTFDNEKLEELTSSIKEYGVIEPIIVKKSIKGYEIVAGERRSKAAKMAGLKSIPAIVKDFTDEEMMSVALLENIQREDLNIIEEANAYKSMIDTMHLTQDELARKIGKSRSHVTNILGILSLPSKVQDMVTSGKISMGHARSISKLDDANEEVDLALRIVNENLSVRDIENIISGGEFKKKVSIKKTEVKDPRKRIVENVLREKIGTLVKVNKNSVVIPYDSDKDLERILEIINIKIDL